MADRYIVGDTPRWGNTFLVDDVETDPTTITLVVTDPAGTATTYTYAGGTVTKASTGTYYKDVPVPLVGLWTVQWTGTGAAADIVTRTYTVYAATVDALDIVTYDEAADALKVGASDISKAARLQAAITAVSRKLDEACGPIVRRTITTEEHDCVGGNSRLWLRWRPVFSVTTVLEYDTAGTSTTLTAETVSSKPSSGYRLERREGLGAPYSGRIFRRASGGYAGFGESVTVTYSAGRYSDTGTVDPVFKEAALITLTNWWQQVIAQAPQGGNELDLPGYRFPRYALPDAVVGEHGIIPYTEMRTRLGFA